MSLDLPGIARLGVDRAFKILESIVVSGTVVDPPGSYDPVTGSTTGSETLYPVAEIILLDYQLKQVDGDIIRKLDKQALFRVSEVPVEITEDMVLRLTGGDWDILDIKKDPANTLYELQIRRP